ncbi:hypothetical protein BMETH_1201_0 [methanotrophic bacterial endosymbiont of Bathymodiolus sp.]|nr:hypothetical protein BMETH_1201_0 [methanotrophic bacterial endosymbiont of Bathymodiolus sp.]
MPFVAPLWANKLIKAVFIYISMRWWWGGTRVQFPLSQLNKSIKYL